LTEIGQPVIERTFEKEVKVMKWERPESRSHEWTTWKGFDLGFFSALPKLNISDVMDLLETDPTAPVWIFRYCEGGEGCATAMPPELEALYEAHPEQAAARIGLTSDPTEEERYLFAPLGEGYYAVARRSHPQRD
jgi:hypothetical protein